MPSPPRAQELTAAVKDAGDGRTAAESIAALSAAIGTAYEANVSVSDPRMAKAAALLSALEAAEEQKLKVVVDDSDGLDSKLNAMFSGGYAMPDESGMEVDDW